MHHKHLICINQKCEPKENFWKQRKKRNQNPKLIILSLYKPNANEIVTQSILMLPYLSRKFQESNLQILTWIQTLFWQLCKIHQYGISFPFPKIHWKYFQNTKPRLWWATICHKLLIHALIIKFGKVKLLKLNEIQFDT